MNSKVMRVVTNSQHILHNSLYCIDINESILKRIIFEYLINFNNGPSWVEGIMRGSTISRYLAGRISCV